MLNLQENQIGSTGTKHLLDALQQNKVPPLNLLLAFKHSFTIFDKTLTTINLGGNPIGDHGAQHLANALQQNKVR